MIKKLLKKIMAKYQQILFVGSTDILPEPLSKEEEIKYVELSMKDNQEAKNKLIEHNLRLVVFLAKKYDNTGTDLEDLVSIGTIGLIKAVNTYRLDKNIKLATKRNKIKRQLREIYRNFVLNEEKYNTNKYFSLVFVVKSQCYNQNFSLIKEKFLELVEQI